MLKVNWLQKLLNLTLWNHIMNNKPNMKCVLTFNKMVECLVAQHLAFAQIFQWQGYGQYGVHGSIVKVPKYLDLM